MRFLLLLMILLLAGEAHSYDSLNTSVQVRGALRDIMHKGDLSAKKELGSLSGEKHLYALGAVEQLKGEILILDSRPYVTYVERQSLHMDSSFQKRASLLVYTQVSEWETHSIPLDVSSYEQFEKMIPILAKNSGINIEEPFPFLLKGNVNSVDWHVIDWPTDDTVHTHEKHIRSGLWGTIENEDVTVLGFYSSKHHAVFTHHTTNMHMHVHAEDKMIAGHVDSITLNDGMTLFLPKQTR